MINNELKELSIKELQVVSGGFDGGAFLAGAAAVVGVGAAIAGGSVVAPGLIVVGAATAGYQFAKAFIN